MPPTYALVGDDDERFVVQPLDSEQAPVGESFLVAKRALSPEMQEQIRSGAVPLAAAHGVDVFDVPNDDEERRRHQEELMRQGELLRAANAPGIPAEGPNPPPVEPTPEDLAAAMPGGVLPPLSEDLARLALEPGAAESGREALPPSEEQELAGARAHAERLASVQRQKDIGLAHVADADAPLNPRESALLARQNAREEQKRENRLAQRHGYTPSVIPLPDLPGMDIAIPGEPRSPVAPLVAGQPAPSAEQPQPPGGPTATDLLALRASALLRGTGGAGGVGVPSARVAPLEETPDFTTEIKANKAAALKALDAQTAVEKGLIARKTAMQQGLIAKTQEVEADYAGRYKKKQEQVDTMRAEVLAKRIDPNRFWSSLTPAGKVQSIIAIMMSGFGQGLQAAGGFKGAPNLALEVLDRQIARDIEAQGADLRTRQTILGQYIDDLGDIRAAGMAAVAQLKSAFAAQYELAALEAGGQQADASHLATAAKLRADSTAQLQQAYARASQIKTDALQRQHVATMLPLDAALRQAEIRKANAAAEQARMAMLVQLTQRPPVLPPVGADGIGRRIPRDYIESLPPKERKVWVDLPDGTVARALDEVRARDHTDAEIAYKALPGLVARYLEEAKRNPTGFQLPGGWPFNVVDFKKAKTATEALGFALTNILVKGTGTVSDFERKRIENLFIPLTDSRFFGQNAPQEVISAMTNYAEEKITEARRANLGIGSQQSFTPTIH